MSDKIELEGCKSHGTNIIKLTGSIGIITDNEHHYWIGNKKAK